MSRPGPVIGPVLKWTFRRSAGRSVVRTGVLGLVAMAIPFGSARGQDADAAGEAAGSVTVDEVAAAVRKQFDRVRSLDVQFDFEAQALTSEEDVKRFLRIVYLTREQRRQAFKGPSKRYAKFVRPAVVPTIAQGVPFEFGPNEPAPQASGDGTGPRRPGADTPEAISQPPEVESAFNGDVLRRKMSGMDSIIVDSASHPTDRGWIQQDYLHCLDMVQPDVFNAASDRAEHNLALALSKFEYRLEPGREPVEDASCLVLTREGHEKVWLDPAAGYALRRREVLDPASGLPRMRFTTHDLREVEPGLWIPYLCHWERFGPSWAPAEQRGKPLFRYVLSVKALNVNNVPDSLFELAFAPGSPVVDRTHVGEDGKRDPVAFNMPADPKRIDEAIQTALKNRDVVRPGVISGDPSRLRWTALGAVILLCGFCAWYVYRKWAAA